MTAELILLALLENSPLGPDAEVVDPDELYCLALNIYHEAAVEPLEGKFGVAHTTLNRVKDERYPDTVCRVVKQYSERRQDIPWLPALNRCQFSWFCDGKPDTVRVMYNSDPIEMNIEAFEVAVAVGLLAMTGLVEDNTGGSTHYYNPELADPNWADFYTPTVRLGNHAFLRREEDSIY